MPSVPGEASGERRVGLTEAVGAAQRDEVSEGQACTGASAPTRAVRVVARGRAASQAPGRSILIAAAVAPGWTWVLPRPRSRGRRTPQARPPWDQVPATPARRFEHCVPAP